MRQQFFGPAGTTRASVRDLVSSVPGYRHFDLDIRDRQGVRDCWPANGRISSSTPRHSPRTTRRLPYRTTILTSTLWAR
jgi:hypothetical protein